MKHFVVFDLDGTLLNTLPDIAGAMNRVLFRFGMPQHPVDSYRQFTGNGAWVLTQRALAGQEEMADHVYSAYLHEYARNSRVNTRPYDGIPQLLQSLPQQGIAAIVYSNKDDGDTRDVIGHYFPQMQFAMVRGALRDVPLKPDPQALNEILDELELSPQDGLYLGDTQMDMQCAKAVGIPAVAALWGFQSEEDLRSQEPEYVIEQPAQMLDIIKERFDVKPAETSSQMQPAATEAGH